jgi:hypothetical protein
MTKNREVSANSGLERRFDTSLYKEDKREVKFIAKDLLRA